MKAAGALVLTAGLGTRLRPLTCVRAKAAVPVNGEPLVRRIMRWLAAQDYRDLVLNLHHKPDTIARCIGDGADLDVHVRYSWEQPVLGSGGGPRHALPLLADPFLIVNGDTLTDVDVGALARLHAASGAAVTMALIPNPAPEKYGGVTVSDDGWVTGFTRRGTPGDSYHFIGVQMARAGVFAALEDGVPAESVATLYPKLIGGHPQSVKAFISDASFEDIGTVDDYLRTSLALAAREGDRLTTSTSQVDDSARLERTAVWDDVVIGARASLHACVVADGVRIPPDASFTRCAIVPAAACAPAADARVEGDLLITPF